MRIKDLGVRKHLRAVDSVVLNTHPSPGQPKAKQNVLGPIIGEETS